MRMIAWFNLAAAAFCALASVNSTHPLGQLLNAALCSANILSAGLNWSSNKVISEPEH